jgi:DNA-binding Lrp family transcriptional regulator
LGGNLWQNRRNRRSKKVLETVPSAIRSKNSVLDDADRAILDLLQQDASRNNVKLSKALRARGVELGPAACGQRKAQLKSQGFIEEITAVLNPAKLSRSQICFLIVRMNENQDRLASEALIELAKADPRVVEIYEIQNFCDYLIKVRVANVGGATSLAQKLRTGTAKVDSFAAGKVLKFTRRIPVLMGLMKTRAPIVFTLDNAVRALAAPADAVHPSVGARSATSGE